MNSIIRILPSSETGPALADLFVAAAREAIVRQGRFAVALSGGHTPAGAYRLLAQEPRRSQVDWSKVHIFWGDERNVPATESDSNERMARDSFLDSVPIPAAQIHPMFMGGDNAEAAASYEKLLRTSFPMDTTFDLVMLGMGPDGHTLSLFPGAGNLDSTNWVVPATTETFAVRDRISLTPLAVSIARQVVFAVEGADKADILKGVLTGRAELPSAVVAERSRDVTWLIDEAAGSKLV